MALDKETLKLLGIQVDEGVHESVENNRDKNSSTSSLDDRAYPGADSTPDNGSKISKLLKFAFAASTLKV